jgi:hypothetical protein
MCFVCFSELTAIISPNNICQLVFVIEKCYVFFEVQTEFLNNNYCYYYLDELCPYISYSIPNS